MSEPEMTVAVIHNSATIFAFDEAGRILAPPDAASRAIVAAALAQAAAQLAALPAPDPFATLAAQLIPALAGIGTDEAGAMMDLVSDRADAATKAVLAAQALIVRHTIAEADQQIAQTEQLLGVTEH